MNTRINALMQDSPVIGLAIALIDNNVTEVDYWGTVEGNLVSEQTIWAVASLTKPVFVYGVLQLVQHGLLDLDCPLQDYLEQPYLNDEKQFSQMTARHAMSHTTGLPNWRDENGLRTNFAPGTDFTYSSEGLNYLQFVVEHISQMPLQEYLKQNIFIPFGMNQSCLGSENQDTLPPYLHFLSGTLLANSSLSLRTSLTDSARFVNLMFTEESLTPYHLTQSWLVEMQRIQIPLAHYPKLFWGLGWGLQQSDTGLAFWHWGARGIPRTMNFVLGVPAIQKAIVIFTNHADGLYLCQQIIEEFFGTQHSAAFDWLLPAQNWRANGRKPEEK